MTLWNLGLTEDASVDYRDPSTSAILHMEPFRTIACGYFRHNIEAVDCTVKHRVRVLSSI